MSPSEDYMGVVDGGLEDLSELRQIERLRMSAAVLHTCWIARIFGTMIYQASDIFAVFPRLEIDRAMKSGVWVGLIVVCRWTGMRSGHGIYAMCAAR